MSLSLSSRLTTLSGLFALVVCLAFTACGNEQNDTTDDNRQTIDTPTDGQAVAKPEPEVNTERAFDRLESVVDLSEEQRTQIQAIYNDLALPEDANPTQIRVRNRELRERVYQEVLTAGQQEEIRAARRERRSEN